MRNKKYGIWLMIPAVAAGIFYFCGQAPGADKSFYRNSLRKDSAREARRSFRTQESRSVDYELGKCVTDVNGAQVRLEEYALRPQADQLKIITLAKRAERTDYHYALYTFNTALPSDFCGAAREGLRMSWSSAPSYWLAGFENKQSSSSDYIKYTATGGGYESLAPGSFTQYFTGYASVVNSELNVKEESLYNPATRSWTYYYYPGGVRTEAKSWETTWDAAINALVYKAYDGAFAAGVPSGSLLATRQISASQSKLQYKTETIYADGKSLTIWNYIVNNRGEVSSVPSLMSEEYMNQVLSAGSYQTVITASEFNGNKVDIISSPSLLMNLNLQQ